MWNFIKEQVDDPLTAFLVIITGTLLVAVIVAQIVMAAGR